MRVCTDYAVLHYNVQSYYYYYYYYYYYAHAKVLVYVSSCCRCNAVCLSQKSACMTLCPRSNRQLRCVCSTLIILKESDKQQSSVTK
jgi:hypothetical protein